MDIEIIYKYRSILSGVAPFSRHSFDSQPFIDATSQDHHIITVRAIKNAKISHHK
jgi:hypothetical protein